MKRLRRKPKESIELSMDEIQYESNDFSDDINSFSERLESIITSTTSRVSSEISEASGQFIHKINETQKCKDSTESIEKKPVKSQKQQTPEPPVKKIIKLPAKTIPTKKEEKLSQKKALEKTQQKPVINQKPAINQELKKNKVQKIPKAVHKKPITGSADEKKYIQEQTRDYMLIDQDKYSSISLFDQIRYINEAGKFVNGGFVVKMEYDLGQSKTFWTVSADRRNTGFSWRISPDKIQKLWKKNIHLPEVDELSRKIDYINTFLTTEFGAKFSKGL